MTAPFTADALAEILRLRGIDVPPDLLADLVPAAQDVQAMAQQVERDLTDLAGSERGDRA
jgi:hypothetical protein